MLWTRQILAVQTSHNGLSLYLSRVLFLEFLPHGPMAIRCFFA